MNYYYYEDKNKLISFACIWINGGSNLDKKDKKGLNHILITLISRGCSGYDNFALSEFIDSYGAELNYQTFEDGILITLKSLKKYFDKLYPILKLIVEKPNLDKNEFFYCKQIAKNHLIKSRENPFNIAFENWRKIAYSDHPYAFETNGYLKDLDNINYEDVLKEFLHFKKREKTFLSNCITEAKSTKNIIDLQDNDSSIIYSECQFTEYLNSSKRILKYHFESNQLIIMLGNQTCPQYSKDFLVLKLLEAHLSYGMSSELFKQFREERGLTYEQGVFYPSRMLNAPFLIYLSVSNENALTAYNLLMNIWESLKTNILNEKEIDLARKKLHGYLLHSQQTLEELLIRKAQLIGFNLNHDLEGKILKSLDQIKPEEIREIANKYFIKSHISIVGKNEITNKIINLWNKSDV